MRSMCILEEMLEMFATTVQAELNATLHVCESCIFLGLVPKETPCIICHVTYIHIFLLIVVKKFFFIYICI
jgi:hypothetical protein